MKRPVYIDIYVKCTLFLTNSPLHEKPLRIVIVGIAVLCKNCMNYFSPCCVKNSEVLMWVLYIVTIWV